MMGKRISADSDFPHTAVYERSGAGGNVYTVSFDNREFVEGWRQFLVFLAILGSLGISILGFANVRTLSAVMGNNLWFVVPASGFVLLAIILIKFKQPWKIKRAIELDFGTDQLRVLRNGQLESARRLSNMDNVTVGNHPHAEASRLKRQEQRQQRPSMNEKRHCLFGWFGTGGGEQVMLLTRAEWPSRNSLFEVRQAVMWAKAIGDARGKHSPDKIEAAGTIKPPLD